MPASFVRGIGGTGADVTSVSLVFGANNNAGNAIVVGAGWYASSASPTIAAGDVTDTRNTYSLATSGTNINAAAGIWYVPNIGAGANTVVVNPAGTNDYINAYASEWADVPTSSLLDVTATAATGTSGTPASGTSGSTSQADTFTVGVVSITSSSTALGIDLPSGYTNLLTQQNGNDFQGVSIDYRVNASAAAQSASWGTLTDSGATWVAILAAFKANAGGGGGGGGAVIINAMGL